MIDPLAEVIAHIPPRPPIDLNPVYPEAEHKLEWELEIEEAAWRAQVGRGERLWEIVVEFARGRGSLPDPSREKGLPEKSMGDALIESEGHSGGGWSAAIEAVMANNEFFDGLMAELEDDRNTTGLTAGEIVREAMERMAVHVYSEPVSTDYTSAANDMANSRIWYDSIDEQFKITFEPAGYETGD